MYDVQTFTDLVINVALSPLQCPATSFIKGVSSGATGFVETSANNTTAVKLTQTSGTFIVGEQIIINGDGKEKLDFTYIEDLYHGIFRCIESKNSKNQIFNITYGEGREVKELIKILEFINLPRHY